MLKKMIAAVLCALILFTVACSEKKPDDTQSIVVELQWGDIDQFGMPQQGETIAVMRTSMGDIKIKFFPEVAPKAVENFITHAQNGYYDGVIFHRVINDFMIQSGDPLGTGTGGQSKWGETFEDEFSDAVRNFRGALSMANRGKNTNGSQFFIVQNKKASYNSLRYAGQQGADKRVLEEYEKRGGTPHLDDAHTVFGHVFSGMEVVDAIAEVEVNSNDKPLEDVVIIGIDIQTVE
ncbi:UNVERIFIED_CONTAM: peptidyl-prolyl cis-trans isomerase B (cyclophilin B) [Acetivibrio alkalicellulosi]